MAQGLSTINAIGIIEKDTNLDVMLTWSYPIIEPNVEPILINRSKLDSDNILPFTFSKFGNQWIYIASVPVEHEVEEQDTEEEEDKTPENDTGKEYPGPLGRVKAFSICLLCKEYNPELYANLCRLFVEVYKKSGTPINVLQGYLRVLTIGKLGEFDKNDFPQRDALLATSVKDIIKIFGMETILLWNALIIKKRVAVYCDRAVTLMRVIRSFPLFIWHRRDWDQLRPIVNMNDEEIQDLEDAKVFCAGFTDPEIKNRTQLYDLLVDLNARTITVSEHAKGDFRLGSFHKDFAEFLVASADDEEMSGLDLLKELASKNQDLIAKLESLQVEGEDGSKTLTLESLQQRLPANLYQFLYAVASAEGLTR